jgi:putative nucleotidyltransferase with HDIG domain
MKNNTSESSSKEIISTLSVLIKTAQIHNVNNVAVTSIIDKLLSILNPLITSDSVKVQLVGEFFHVNENRVRYTMESVFNFDFLIKEFRKNNLGTIVFHDTLQVKDIKCLIDAVTTSGLAEDPFDLIDEKLHDIPSIDIEELKNINEETSDLDKKKLTKKTYFSTVALTRGIINNIKSGETINLKKIKRTVRTVIDQLIEDDTMLMGMTTIKDYDEYTHYHSVNVSILSISLGHKLGLDKKLLSDLGMAALLHDIGKVDIPIEVLNKPSEFTEDEWNIMRKHSEKGALLLLKTKGIDDSSMNQVIPAFEHHLNYNLSGYPKIRNSFTLDFFSRVITIADQYDAMTSARVYSRKPLSSEKALSVLIERSGTQVDPHILKVFINMVGIYPIGSLVVLNTNEMGLVFENNNNPDFMDRPRILLISDSSGARIENIAVNLMEKNEEGDYKWSIEKVLDPSKFNINLAEYLL